MHSIIPKHKLTHLQLIASVLTTRENVVSKNGQFWLQFLGVATIKPLMYPYESPIKQVMHEIAIDLKNWNFQTLLWEKSKSREMGI